MARRGSYRGGSTIIMTGNYTAPAPHADSLRQPRSAGNRKHGGKRVQENIWIGKADDAAFRRHDIRHARQADRELRRDFLAIVMRGARRSRPSREREQWVLSGDMPQQDRELVLASWPNLSLAERLQAKSIAARMFPGFRIRRKT